MEKLTLNDGYKLANCCNPETADKIRGYYSYNGIMIVHKSGCINLNKVEPDRLVILNWNEILADQPDRPDDDYNDLEPIDFRVLDHHHSYGVDYSLKVARILNLEKQAVFDSHFKLREMKLLTRIKKLMIQYRKGVVDNKWIKHRNHTYYELTAKGILYIEYYKENK